MATYYVISVSLGEGSPLSINSKIVMGKVIDYKATIFIEYSDSTGYNFELSISGTECEIVASLMQITRGTLMASNAVKATCYKPDCFELCAYYQK